MTRIAVKCLLPGMKDSRIAYADSLKGWPIWMAAAPKVGDLIESTDGRQVRQVREVVYCDFVNWGESYVRIILEKPRVNLFRCLFRALGVA